MPFDRAVGYYDATRGLPGPVRFALGAALARELEGRSTLEVGVGTARISGPLAQRGTRVIGVDLSRPMLRRALEQGLGVGVIADGAHLPFRDRAFDASITVHLTHLLADWAEVLREICRVSRTEYLTVIEGPEAGRESPASEYYRALREEGISPRHPGRHEWRLAEEFPPDRWLPPIEYTGRSSTDALLEMLAGRQWSNQWSIPDEPHRRAVERARSRFPIDREILSPQRIRIAVWAIARLEEHLTQVMTLGPTAPGEDPRSEPV